LIFPGTFFFDDDETGAWNVLLAPVSAARNLLGSAFSKPLSEHQRQIDGD
jgi:hypothetical protein